MKWVFRVLCALLCPLCAAVFVGVGAVAQTLPATFYVDEGDTLSLPTALCRVQASGAWQTQATAEGEYDARVMLFGVIPVQAVNVQVAPTRDVAVCGVPFGIKMFTEGVLVVGISDVDTRHGAKSPAREAGLRVGDSVLSVDGEAVSSTEQVASLIGASGGRTLTLRVRRQQTEFDVKLTPVASVTEQTLKAGMWIRDSSAGIGTLTFYDMQSGVFAGLGHPVNDVDTGQSVPISTGEIVPAAVFGVTKGQVGSPGELLGRFCDGSWGVLTKNDETGLYGMLGEQPPAFATLPIAYKQEVVEGEATLITTVNGDRPLAYRVMIEEVDYRDGNPTQNMVIRITDEALLAETGGVVCGMSGSPIVQNGKLVGAVTHVFVGDPTSGYAVFAENMLQTAQTVPPMQQDAAS
ncbi:MAG: SpoIVB peptidase [Clostridia bacterium]|nr:SpoIVB peptidase [Clostridia bacterium]